MCRALGLRLERLVRTRFGPVELGALPRGASRALTPREQRAMDALLRGEPPVRETGAEAAPRVNHAEVPRGRKSRRRPGYDRR
jgi:hypothetical protein